MSGSNEPGVFCSLARPDSRQLSRDGPIHSAMDPDSFHGWGRHCSNPVAENLRRIHSPQLLYLHEVSLAHDQPAVDATSISAQRSRSLRARPASGRCCLG